MHYKSITVTERGSTDVMKVIKHELRDPKPGEARIRILATHVCQDDIEVRKGNRPFAAKPPFIPGYSIIGVVDEIGEGVHDVEVGDKVAALVNFGGYAEFIYWPANELAHVPGSVDPAQAIPLILNYLVAYQILYRVAKVKQGDVVLINGASGGVGTAFLQLGKLSGLKMYGTASKAKHDTLRQYGAIPIDYRGQDFVQVLMEAEPQGIDFAFNGMAEDMVERCLAVLGRGGMLVHYGGPTSTWGLFVFICKFLLYKLLPNGKKLAGYGTHRGANETFKEDWAKLFALLEADKIKPVIAAHMPIMDAIKANQMLEGGQVTGNIVLLAPESVQRYHVRLPPNSSPRPKSRQSSSIKRISMETKNGASMARPFISSDAGLPATTQASQASKLNRMINKIKSRLLV